MSLSLAYIILEKAKDFFIIMKAISESPCHFLNAQKVTKKAPANLGFPDSPLIHPGLLAGRRHPWPFDWQLNLGFRSRPLFFIREKKRRRRHPWLPRARRLIGNANVCNPSCRLQQLSTRFQGRNRRRFEIWIDHSDRRRKPTLGSQSVDQGWCNTF
jgi:hypothetical protein